MVAQKPHRAELWIGWRDRYDGPLAEPAIAELDRLASDGRNRPSRFAGTGYIEVPCGRNKIALFDQSRVYGVRRWTLHFIAVDGDTRPLFPLYDHPSAVLGAIRAVVALGDGTAARAARRALAAALDAEEAARQTSLF